jgi:hypothetical protein
MVLFYKGFMLKITGIAGAIGMPVSGSFRKFIISGGAVAPDTIPFSTPGELRIRP